MSENSGWLDYGSDSSKSREIAVLRAVIVEPTPARYIRLGSIRQIRYELAAIYRAARNREIATGEATRLTYILVQLSNLTMESEIAERVEKLEQGK